MPKGTFPDIAAHTVTCTGELIMKKCLFKYTENFTTKKKNENFPIKNSDMFHISTQNIGCGFPLEPVFERK